MAVVTELPPVAGLRTVTFNPWALDHPVEIILSFPANGNRQKRERMNNVWDLGPEDPESKLEDGQTSH